MELPKNEHSFYFTHEGKLTGRKYEGDFKVKCLLSIADQRVLEIEKSGLTVDLNNPTDNLNAIGSVVSNLRVRVLDAPDWFKQSIRSLDILDEEVLFEIYSKCLEAETKWISDIRESTKKEEIKEGN